MGTLGAGRDADSGVSHLGASRCLKRSRLCSHLGDRCISPLGQKWGIEAGLAARVPTSGAIYSPLQDLCVCEAWRGTGKGDI